MKGQLYTRHSLCLMTNRTTNIMHPHHGDVVFHTQAILICNRRNVPLELHCCNIIFLFILQRLVAKMHSVFFLLICAVLILHKWKLQCENIAPRPKSSKSLMETINGPSKVAKNGSSKVTDNVFKPFQFHRILIHATKYFRLKMTPCCASLQSKLLFLLTHAN